MGWSCLLDIFLVLGYNKQHKKIRKKGIKSLKKSLYSWALKNFLNTLWKPVHNFLLLWQNNTRPQYCGRVRMAGETRFEHATSGFGDRCSTIEPLPFKIRKLTYYNKF